jgi:hypothetical protein
MSLTKQFRSFVTLAAALLTARGALMQEHPAATEISCPAVLLTSESAMAPSGWTAESAKIGRTFLRISVFQRSSIGREFDLAPDSTTNKGSVFEQNWAVPHDAPLKTYLRCRYKDTEATATTELGQGIKECSFTFRADSHGAVVEPKQARCFGR